MSTQNKRLDPDYQRNVDRFVANNVLHCASTLVYELAQKAEHFPDYQEDFIEAFSGPVDYEEVLAQQDIEPYKDSFDALCWRDLDGATMAGNAQEACEFFGLDAQDYACEVFEHWIITESLADRLEQKGEKIIRDFFGFGAIWCRTTTGQAISMDDVICRIYDETQEAN